MSRIFGFMWNDLYVDPKKTVEQRGKSFTGWVCGSDLTSDVLSWGNSKTVTSRGYFELISIIMKRAVLCLTSSAAQKGPCASGKKMYIPLSQVRILNSMIRESAALPMTLSSI